MRAAPLAQAARALRTGRQAGLRLVRPAALARMQVRPLGPGKGVRGGRDLQLAQEGLGARQLSVRI